MKCQTTETLLDQWYRVKQQGQIIGYHCGVCYDKIRRAPLFQNFKKKLAQRLCSSCGRKTTTTLTRLGFKHERWYKDGKDGWYCNTCHHRILVPFEVRQERNSRRMQFKDRIISLSENPRKGYCQWCSNNLFDGSCKRTQMHHKKYHADNPLKDTVELCASCHKKESLRLRREGG